MQPLSIHTHYREKFSKRYPFHEEVSFQFSEQNRKVSPIGFESEDYMLYGQRALWPGYPCSNGKLPFSHCQGNIAESTKLEVTATLVFLFSFLFFFSLFSNIFMPSDGACVSSSDSGDNYDDSQEQSIEIIRSMIKSDFFTCDYYFRTHEINVSLRD